MEKTLLWAMLLLFGSLTATAQNKIITVSGNVVESDTKEATIQATVQLLSLPDSTYIAGVATLAGGKFTFPKVQAGKYVLKVSYMGFRTQFVPIQLTANSVNHSVGTISLRPNTILLQETVIVAEAPPITVSGDTVIYSASAYRVAEGAMLEDLVKKIPGIEVSDEGKITVNGKEISKIMVDGKEFFSDDPKVSMKNLPAEIVENVKTYDKKSDMARITGIDDGDEETVLDLTVKKGMKRGWFGNIIGGYGNKDRYELGGMMNRFTDDANFTILGNANNTNGQGFSEFGDAGQGMNSGRTGSGITSSKSLGLNYAKDTKKLQAGGNVQYGYSNTDARRTSSTERFLGDESSYGNSINSSLRKRHDVRADIRLEWRPDTMTTIIFRPNASYSRTEASGVSWSETRDNNFSLVNDKNENTFSKSNNFSLNGRLEVYRKLNNKGRNLSLRGSFGYTDSGTDSDTDSETFLFSSVPYDTLSVDRYTDRTSDSRDWSLSASYTEPVFKNHFLQLRYGFSHSKRLAESLSYDNLSTTPQVYVDSLSSHVENFYDTHDIDLSIRGIHPKMMYSAGVTLTPQSSRSETTIGPNKDNQLPRQNVFNFAPQVMLRYMFDKRHTLVLRYRGRSSAPNIEYLQEVIDQSDPLKIQYGNPELKPSFSHNAMMFYSRYLPESMSSYSLNAFYTRTQNSVANKTTYIAATGGTVSQRVNVNGNWNARANLTYNTPLKNQKFTISSHTNTNFSDAVSYSSVSKSGEADKESELSTTHNFVLGERVTGNYRANSFDISLNASLSYNLTKNNKQTNSNRETFDYIFGGSTNITFPWQISLSTDLNLKLKDGYSGESFNNSELMWNAQLSKSLLKNNAGTIRIKFYDILKQQTNLSRSISETMMSDTESNTLGSYFMVHFVFKLNTLVGKGRSSDRDGMRRFGPDGQGGPPSGGGGGGRPGRF